MVDRVEEVEIEEVEEEGVTLVVDIVEGGLIVVGLAVDIVDVVEGGLEVVGFVVGVVGVVGGGVELETTVGLVVGVMGVVEVGLGLEVVGFGDEVHDATEGSVTPYCAQTWSARLTIAVKYS